MKIQKIISNLIHTRVIVGSKFQFYYYYLMVKALNFFRRHSVFLDIKIKKVLLKMTWPEFVIRNQIGKFEVTPFDDSVTISANYFESDIEHWLNTEDKEIFIDIGANIGRYSILSVRKYGFKKCLSFEANQVTFKKLNKNILLNGLKEKIETVNAALGREIKTVKFLRDHFHKGGSRVVDENYVLRESDIVNIMSLTTLDEFLKINSISPNSISFIKIDVEGYENDILEGMKDTLSELKIGTSIMIELSDNIERSIEKLKQFGFKRKECLNNDNLFQK